MRTLDSDTVHYRWDRSLNPRLEVESGDIVTLEIRGGGDDYYTPQSSHQDVMLRPPFSGHPLTGPILVQNASPGDALEVRILSLEIWDWGYTFIGPGVGLLHEELSGPFLKIWDLSNGETTPLRPGIEVPIDPFLGILGVAPAQPGEHSTMPPRRVGGNIDIKQLTAGSTVWLPIEVEGALFSAGDAHAAQGDGEVCVTAIETGATVTLQLSLVTDMQLSAPQFETGGPIVSKSNQGPWHGTTGIGPDLMEATKDATRSMIRYLERAHGLTSEEAYVLCSVAMDLKISEVVDAPNWVVSALIPLSIFKA